MATDPKSVLLIDDSQLAIKKIGAILQQLNCQVIEAEDGRIGLSLALTSKPDLIILDVQMPKLNGLETLKILRQNPKFKDRPIRSRYYARSPCRTNPRLYPQR